ncbi:MAG: endonuclease [Tannerellaceae bacterium]
MPILLLLLFFIPPLSAQERFRVMSYNVENLFDTADNPVKEDGEFLPSSVRHWTPGRYYRKLQQLAKVINAAGEWETPALIGLCEVENDSTLIHLLSRTPLRQQGYRYCVTQSPDKRGINVALLYQRDRFRLLGQFAHPIRYSRKEHKQSRELLHVWGQLLSGDTLDIFVCHFPSRYGGEKKSETDRADAARTLRGVCDSLHQQRNNAQIIIMGDFNDLPSDISLCEVLAAQPMMRHSPTKSDTTTSFTEKPPLLLYNLFADPKLTGREGSHKYQGEWSQLDQLIVSSNLLRHNAPFQLKEGSAHIFAPDFLLIKDKTWRGTRPFRTYYGFKYEGGYSDHLPILVDFISR